MTPTTKRSLNILEVKSPCDEPWSEMKQVGPGQRNCALCMQDVYDLSEMTKEEAEDLIFESTGRVCVRFYRRMDGSIVTRDCSPVRFRRLHAAGRSSMRLAAKVVGGAVALLTLLGIARVSGFSLFSWAGATQGEMAVQGAIASPLMGEPMAEGHSPHTPPGGEDVEQNDDSPEPSPTQ